MQVSDIEQKELEEGWSLLTGKFASFTQKEQDEFYQAFSSNF